MQIRPVQLKIIGITEQHTKDGDEAVQENGLPQQYALVIPPASLQCAATSPVVSACGQHPDFPPSALEFKRDELSKAWRDFLQSEDFINNQNYFIYARLKRFPVDNRAVTEPIIQRFAQPLKERGIVDGFVNFGGLSACFLVSSGDKKVVMKCLFDSESDNNRFEYDNLLKLQNISPDFVQKLSVDEKGEILSKRGEALITDFIKGEHIKLTNYVRHKLDDEQIVELIEFYMNACEKGVSIRDAGGLNNSLMHLIKDEKTDESKIRINIFDFGTPSENDEAVKIFQANPLAGSIHHLLTKDVLFECSASMPGNKVKGWVMKAANDAETNDFNESRFNQLITGLEKLVSDRKISTEQVVEAVDYLLKLQSEQSVDDYFKFTTDGVRYLERIKNHFSE